MSDNIPPHREERRACPTCGLEPADQEYGPNGRCRHSRATRGGRPLDKWSNGQAERDQILQIVADHIHRDTTYGGLDWDDLIEDLRRAGYTLPDPTEHPKEN